MIPSGTVTFLFTDIEGSTKLSQEFPDTLQAALERHHSIMRNALESNKGFIFENVGDAFCCAFHDASDAVKAACDAQINLTKEKWNDAVIKVRMGIHSGSAEWTETGKRYMGYITLARTARVMSCANGGQILISNNAYEFAKENLKVSDQPSPAGTGISEPAAEYEIAFRDLGERRLKDLIHPIRLFQLVSSKLPSEFPPLKTLDARPNNLPVQLTSFIGRGKEMSDLKKGIKEKRLLTLIGHGGTGKTRLALQVAADLIDDFVNGVWFIELASVQDPDLIIQSITNTFGIKEQPGQSQEENLIQYLKDKKILIILDNCEQLIGACSHLSEKLLQSSSGLKIIATSREALRCSGEETHQVLPLDFPDPKKDLSAENLTQYEAVRLFIERALAVNQKFRVTNDNAPALAQICFQLDGIPFAIELAAARIKILSLEDIYGKLSDRFKLLTGGKRTALPRQQTLRALIDWSYDLLTEKEKLLLQRLSVFSGGWTLEAAEEICSDDIINADEVIDLLTALLDKSLIVSKETSMSMRFSMLESIKQYAKEKLYNIKEINNRHFNYFKNLCDHHEAASNGIEQLEWINLVESDRDNVRLAIKWAEENNADQASDLINDITEFWNIKGYFSEGVETCQGILNKNPSISELNLAKLLYNTGLMSHYLSRIADAEKYAKEALFKFRILDNKEGIVNCLILLGANLTLNQITSDDTERYYNEALLISKELNMKKSIGLVKYNLSFVLARKGDIDLSLESKQEALDISKELGDTHQITLTLASLGVSEFRRENFEKARAYTEESLVLSYQLGDNYLISINLTNLGCIHSGLKDFANARNILNQAIDILREYRYKTNMVPALYYMGEVVTNLGDNEKAINSYKESILIGSEIGVDFFLIHNFYGLGISCFNIKDFENSVKYFSFMKTFADGNYGYSGRLITNSEKYSTKLREILGSDVYEKYRSEGLSMNKEEMINFALR